MSPTDWDSCLAFITLAVLSAGFKLTDPLLSNLQDLASHELLNLYIEIYCYM